MLVLSKEVDEDLIVIKNVKCLICGDLYTQRGPAGYGKCGECFFKIWEAESKYIEIWWAGKQNIGDGI